MNVEKNLSFKQIDYLYPLLPKIIALSIGAPTVEKIAQVLESYKNDKQYIIGCFVEQKLIAIIGVELLLSNALIKHISVLEKFRSQGIASQMIQYVIKHFSLIRIDVETDEESVGFYQTLGFVCKAFNGNYGIRYKCILDLTGHNI